MYKCKYFAIQELAHPWILNKIGETNTWLRLDEDVLRDLDTIRETWYDKHGSGVYCNRLDVGIDSRGFRPPNDPDGAWNSTHKQGNTFDLEPVNGLQREFFNHIKQLIKDRKLRKINTLEDFEYTKTWTHAGYMNTDERPLIIKP
tara:strand:- start:64 stop:498 length:435 start_codon:yes stop_codon:yes gene_type:complete